MSISEFDKLELDKQKVDHIPKGAVCHFTKVPFAIINATEEWRIVPSTLLAEADPTSAALFETELETTHTETKRSTRNQHQVGSGSANRVIVRYALKTAIEQIVACRSAAMQERDSFVVRILFVALCNSTD